MPRLKQWQDTTLGKVAAEVTVGYVGPMADKYVPSGVPFLRSLNVEPFRLDLHEVKYIDEEFHRRLQKSSLAPGDVVIVRTGKPGAAVVIPESLPVANCSDLVVVRPGPQLDPRFLVYYINSSARHHVSAYTVGAVQQHFNISSAKEMRLNLPPLWEQRAIARILGALDDKIELNRRMNHTLEEMARAIFKSWFVDFDPVTAKSEGRQPYGMNAETAALIPSAFQDSELGPIPKGWHVAKLGDVCELAYGKSLTANNRSSGDVAVFGSDGQIGWHDAALVKGPGIVIGRKGNAGKVNWSQGNFFPIDTTFYVQLRMENLPLNYLFYVLQLLDLPNVSGDSAVPGLNREMAYSLDTLIPAQSVLEVFERLLSPLRSRIDANEQESRTLAAIRDALLPKLLSGEIRVKQAEKALGTI
jgi:type I restriction enzyme S subunit